jgi:Calcineurin-like phosphoesterase
VAGAEGFEPSALGFGDRCSDQTELRPYRPLRILPDPQTPPTDPATIDPVTAPALPVLIVGDVHGDLERLFSALKPYPADEWRTFFLGDLVDYGVFGVGALRYARDRPNSEVLLGNHEVALLWALREPARIGYWISVGGQRHDLDELVRDEPLQCWLRDRPALLRLSDGTLLQHCGHDGYRALLDGSEVDPVQAINARARELLTTGGEARLWDLMSGRNVFDANPYRLQSWLDLMHARRVVFGHTPHIGQRPETYHGGRALNYDGGLGGTGQRRRRSPLAATVAPLPD